MSEFTPGPWRYYSRENQIQGEFLVAHIYEQPTEKIKLLNASLIAAAPEMYEALQIALKLITDSYSRIAMDEGYWPTVKPIVAQIDAALAKADGRRV